MCGNFGLISVPKPRNDTETPENQTIHDDDEAKHNETLCDNSPFKLGSTKSDSPVENAVRSPLLQPLEILQFQTGNKQHTFFLPIFCRFVNHMALSCE